MVEPRFWRWSISPERPAIEYVQRDVDELSNHTTVSVGMTSSPGTADENRKARIEAASPSDASARKTPAQACLQLEEHNVFRPGQMAPVLNRLSARFDGGRTYFVIGVNGVGKTLFLKSLARRGAKSVIVHGRAPGSIIYSTCRERISDEPITVRQFLRLVGGMDGVVSWSLDGCAHRKVQVLSQGERTRLALAIAETANPVVLLLDEPTLGLDDEGLERLARLLKRRREQGLVTLVASHELILFDEDGGELVLMEHDHECARLVPATSSVILATAAITSSDQHAPLEVSGAASTVARKLLDLQKQCLKRVR